MYMKDKANRITLRLNDEQFNFVKSNADIVGVSPSEFLRMIVNATMSMTKSTMAQMKDEEGNGRENDKANINNIV